MAVIRVPKTPKRAFNKSRPASSLLRSQLDHLEWAVRPASQRKPHQLPKAAVKTEGEAAARIGELTRMLRPDAAHPTVPVITVPQPAAPRTVRRIAQPKKTRRTKPASTRGRSR
jgi:hypothetical protein